YREQIPRHHLVAGLRNTPESRLFLILQPYLPRTTLSANPLPLTWTIYQIKLLPTGILQIILLPFTHLFPYFMKDPFALCTMDSGRALIMKAQPNRGNLIYERSQLR